MNKEIESILLTENEEVLKKLDDYFSNNYKDTLLAMFTVLINAVRTKTINDINLILSNIEMVLLEQNASCDKLIIDAVKDANNKLSTFRSIKENRELRNIKFRLVDINRKIKEKKETENSNALYNFYYYIVFEEKNIELLEALLESEKNILAKKDSNDKNILYNIIDYFSSLNEEDDDLDYFYDVIVLFLESEEAKLIKEERYIYLDLLNRKHAKYKSHVKEIISRFSEFNKINTKKLERRYGISRKFHDEIYEELESLGYDTNNRRIINGNFITIDGSNATCLDDAICMVKNDDGSFYNYVAIADIASFVPYQSKIYYDAMQKEETLYLVDDIISMYPDIIANNYCSLLPNGKKNVIVYKVLVDPNYNVDMDSLEIIKGVITPSLKLDYATANSGIGLPNDIVCMLNDLALFSLKLRSQNLVKEEYRKIENIVRSDAKHHQSFYVDSSISANIIQEEMLLVNYLSASYFAKRDLVYLYRNHQIKTDGFINMEIKRLFNNSHIDFNTIDYDKLFKLVRDSYLNASYSSVNKGHVGLGYSAYSHSTASNRRFADSFNQYLTHMQVFNSNISSKLMEELFEEASLVSQIINERKKDNDKFTSEYNYLYAKKLIRKK